jgi:UDP-N-acetylmuramoyl-L-alanyl-D-glutamate--2,6-diaminopimelate ligase
MSFALAELLRGVDCAVAPGEADLAITVNEVRDDSRLVRPGDLFVAVPGTVHDGREFIVDAGSRGATVVVAETLVPAFRGVVVRVPRARQALGRIAANRYGAASALTLHAVTGTNGKTTTTYLVEGMLRAAGRGVGVIGTVAYRTSIAGQAPIVKPAPLTTPGALALHALFAEMRAAGASDVVLEASSHALDQGRLDGCRFRVAALTNLTQDHLDFHGTMDAYFDAKAILFERLLDARGVAVVPVDKEEGVRLRARCKHPVIGVSTRAGTPGADVRVEQVVMGGEGTLMKLLTPSGPLEVISPLVGDFNVENLALAVGMGIAADLPLDAIAKGLATKGAPGRLERVPNDRGVLCFVDYAHTPDALERALTTVRPLADRLVVVFGCGGDRDAGKRPLMGRIAIEKADLAIVTSDNPRTENPERIIDMIVDGISQHASPQLTPDKASSLMAMMPSGRVGWCRLEDRREAIGLATSVARPGDVVLIAGKGHEDYQIVGTTKAHFDDREEAGAAFARLGKGAA